MEKERSEKWGSEQERAGDGFNQALEQIFLPEDALSEQQST